LIARSTIEQVIDKRKRSRSVGEAPDPAAAPPGQTGGDGDTRRDVPDIDGPLPEGSASDRDHLSKVLLTKQRRLKFLELYQARKGINTEVDVLTEIEDLQQEITKLKQQLGMPPDGGTPHTGA
jgi:hypothetical protein